MVTLIYNLLLIKESLVAVGIVISTFVFAFFACGEHAINNLKNVCAEFKAFMKYYLVLN